MYSPAKPYKGSFGPFLEAVNKHAAAAKEQQTPPVVFPAGRVKDNFGTFLETIKNAKP